MHVLAEKRLEPSKSGHVQLSKQQEPFPWMIYAGCDPSVMTVWGRGPSFIPQKPAETSHSRFWVSLQLRYAAAVVCKQGPGQLIAPGVLFQPRRLPVPQNPKETSPLTFSKFKVWRPLNRLWRSGGSFHPTFVRTPTEQSRVSSVIGLH